MQAQQNNRHMEALRNADMVIPDGTPLVWVSRARGQTHMHRVSGPDIMTQLRIGYRKNWRHYFYGGAVGIADDTAEIFEHRFPGRLVAGTQSPPFRELTCAEMDTSIEEINEAHPDIVWVGLGCPERKSGCMRTRRG